MMRVDDDPGPRDKREQLPGNRPEIKAAVVRARFEQYSN
jgi:hypothetical protein